jgi:hypothetical protein
LVAMTAGQSGQSLLGSTATMGAIVEKLVAAGCPIAAMLSPKTVPVSFSDYTTGLKFRQGSIWGDSVSVSAEDH